MTSSRWSARAERQQGATRTAGSREQQDDGFQQESRALHETTIRREYFPSAPSQETGHTAPIIKGPDDTKLIRPTFSSSLFKRLRTLTANQNTEQSLHRFTQKAEDSSCCWILGQRSGGDLSPSREKTIKDRIKDNSILDIPCQTGTNRDNGFNRRFSSGDYPDVRVKGFSESDSCVTAQTGCDYAVNKGQTEFESKTHSVETSDPNTSMLSSSMVTVLAPHWNSRLRRNKRLEGMNNPQGSLQDVTNTATNCSHEPFHRFVERPFTGGMQEPSKFPFIGTKGETDNWSTKSGPASLGSECKRRMIHTVSVDLNCQRIDKRRMAAGAVSSSPTALIPIASDDQKNNPESFTKTGLSSLSSKPTTSSLLLSLRRFNSNSRISNAPSPLPDIDQAPSDQNAKLFPACPSQSIHRNNEDKSKPLFSPFISCKTSEAGPLHSLPSSTHSERLKFETCFISASSEDKDLENMPFNQQSQPTRAQSNLLCSKPTPPIRGLTKKDPNFRSSDINVLSENLNSAGLGSRRTTLTSTSWWKQVSQEGVSPLKLNETSSSKEKLNTPSAPTTNDNNNNNKDDMPSANPLYIKRFNSPISNRDNKNATAFFHKDSINLVTKPQGGSQKLKQRISEDSHEPDSDLLSKQQNESKSNRNQPQTTPGVFQYSKISRASAQTLSHSEDLTQGVGGSFTPTPIRRNPKRIDSPIESSSAYKTYPTAFQNTSSTTSPFCVDAPIKPPLHIQAITPKTANNLLLSSNKTDPTINIKPLSPMNNSHTPSHTRSSSQRSRFTPRGNVSPLGFERSYDSIPKPRPKVAFSPIPTVRAFCKTDSGPVSNTSAVLSTTANQPENVPSMSPTTHSVTPALMSHSSSIPLLSPLTPPTTPNITSPNLESCSTQEGKESSDGQERDSKRHSSEENRPRRVTWEDSVDLQSSESTMVKILESPQVPTSSLSPSRSSPAIKAPSIFSILRSSSPSTSLHLCPPTSKTSSIQVSKGEKYQSFSTDCADPGSRGSDQPRLRPSSPPIFNLKTKELPLPRQDRTVSLESGIVQSRLSSPLSLPPDFLSGYKLRYSSPPYSTLMSARSTQGESKPMTPRSEVFQQPVSYSLHLCKPADSARTLPPSKPPPLPVTSPHPPALQNKTPHEDLNFGVSETHQISNNDQNNNHDVQDRNIFLVKNRVHISSPSLQGTKAQSSPPKCVTETLVYTINTPKSSTPKPPQQAENTTLTVETKNSKQSNKVPRKKATREVESCSSGSSSTDSHSTDERSTKVKDSALSKSRFFTVQSSNEQSPKKSRFALKRSVSTPNSSLLRSETERTNKTNNKVDQVLTRLRQTFSTRRYDDDLSFPWKWKRNSQAPFIGGSSDISNVRDVPAETKATEEPEQETGKSLTVSGKETQSNRRWTHEENSVIPMTISGGTMAAEKVLIRSNKLTPLKGQVQPITSTELMLENKIKSPTIQRRAAQQFDFNKDTRTEYKPTNQLLICKDPCPGRSSTPSTDFPPQFTKSTPSPRSPFSPFSSISPLSPFPSPDVPDDVFYSPKLQRRRESPLPCDAGEGLSPRTPERSQTSTRSPSVSSVHKKNHSASLYADLKYGIEPGRSFSVSSVLSSRPSGPGRISTGSRFMSVGDLSNSTMTCRGSEDSESWSISPDWTAGKDSLPSKDSLISYFSSDPGKMKTRSLPRSLTRRLANWSSDVLASPSVTMETTKPARLWSPNMNMTTFDWDTEGPPTPPPTPPLSPMSRPMSKPPSSSSPTFPSSPGPLRGDSPSAIGHRPSRSYVSSLSTFEESSDSSDTTTDDEYFLETSEEDKETEL